MTIITVCKHKDDDYTASVRGDERFAVIAELEAIIPPYVRRFLPDVKAWRIRSDHLLHLWLFAVAPEIAEVEWEGLGQAYAMKAPKAAEFEPLLAFVYDDPNITPPGWSAPF